VRDQSIDTFKTKVNYMLIERIDKEIIITTGSMHEMNFKCVYALVSHTPTFSIIISPTPG
jgi:hypothetical protein